MKFETRVVCVTGGSRGIGRAMVEAFAQNGAKVFFTFHRDKEAAAEVCRETGAISFQCPQDRANTISQTVDSIINAAGKIDILVNNAGITRDRFLMIMPDEEWQKVLDTNLNGAYRWSKAVLRPMLSAQSGVIINISSVAGLVGIGGQTNYAASKGALLAFNRALAAECGPKGIRVNAVVPGYIDTDMTARMPRQIKHDNRERILLRRFGTVHEVAHAVLFLASDQASYITGAELIVDGGLTSTVIQ